MHKGKRERHVPEYLRQAFEEYVSLLVQGKAPKVMVVNGQRESARHVVCKLRYCTDPLPDIRCQQLDIPSGSTYARAARSLMPIENACIDCETRISTRATRCRSCKGLAQWADPETRTTLLATTQSPQYRERQSERLKAVWEANPELREERAHRMREMWEDPAYRRGRVQATKQLWQTEEYREKQRQIYESEEGHRVRSESASARWEDEECRRRRSEQTKELWRNEGYRRRQAAAKRRALQNPETHRRMSEAARRREEQKRAQREGE